MLRRVHANSANLFHGRSPLSEICNDLILAQSMPSGAVHTITPLPKFKLGHYPPSVVSLTHTAALPRAHRSGRQARVQNAITDADRHAAAFGGRMTPNCPGLATRPVHV